MINTKKMITLGVLAVTGLGFVGATTANAASTTPQGTAGGSTSISWNPGQSSGTDGDGTVTDWTVDYPVSLPLGDDNTSATSAKTMTFKLLKTKNDGTVADTDYDGTATVDVSLKKPSHVTGNYINLGTGVNNSDFDANVTLGLTSNKTEELSLAGGENISVASLTAKNTGNENEKEIGAFIKSKGNAEKGTSYSTELTWVFTGTQSR